MAAGLVLADGSMATEMLSRRGRRALGWAVPNHSEELGTGNGGTLRSPPRPGGSPDLDHIAFLDASIARLTAEIAKRVGPFEPAIELLCGRYGTVEARRRVSIHVQQR